MLRVRFTDGSSRWITEVSESPRKKDAGLVQLAESLEVIRASAG
jgi:hypothetical protein